MLSILRKFFFSSEIIRLILLGILVTYAYWPFLSNINLGSGDAYWYHSTLASAIDQLHHGIFPAYVTQGSYNYFGNALMRAPYYILLGQFLDIFTFGKLSTLLIQHLTIYFSAFCGAFLFYFLGTRLRSELPWATMLFAFFYVSCPGVISLIYLHDMYYSFMAVPLLVLFVYGLKKLYQKEDGFTAMLMAATLSLLLMAHPPIALWTIAVYGIFLLVLLFTAKKRWKTIPLTASLFILFSLWQIVSVFSLGIGSNYGWNMSHTYANEVVTMLRGQMPGVFLPLGWGKNSNEFALQLGYTLWLAVILGTGVACIKKNTLFIRCLLICMAFIGLLLYPLPGLGHILWDTLPNLIKNITLVWPNQRFYMILAALGSFIGWLALHEIRNYINQHKKMISSLFILLLFWNLYQLHFIHLGIEKDITAKSWHDKENLNFTFDGREKYFFPLFEGAYDPLLKNRLLNAEKKPLTTYDNEMIAANLCLQNSHTVAMKSFVPFPQQLNFQPNISHTLSQFTVLPNKKYLYCMSIESKASKPLEITLEITGEHFPTRTLNPAKLTFTKLLLIPFYSDQRYGKNLSVHMNTHVPLKMKLKKEGLTIIDPLQLPIKIDAFMPYKAHVQNSLKGDYLEIFKQYLPGYKALVNGKKVDVLESPAKLLMVPLVQGKNVIQLNYIGTPAMKMSFYLSGTTWALCMLYLFYRNLRRQTTRKALNLDI